MSAAKFGLGNLVGIVDWNRGQIDGHVEEVMPLEPLEDKWKAFGWRTKVIDGHDYGAILDACAWASESQQQPSMILASRVLG